MADNKDGEENNSHGNEHKLSELTDNKEGEEAVTHGNDWEVVSLTASTYAASPGPMGDESIYKERDPTASKDYDAETSSALFMSGHFVFPPTQHENLPIEPEKVEKSGVMEDEAVGDMSVAKEGKTEQKEEENWRIEELNVSEDFPDIPLREQKGDQMLSIHGSEFDESTTLHRLNDDQKEKFVYETAAFSSFHDATDISGSEAFGESMVVSDILRPSDEGIDPLPFLSKPCRSENGDETDDLDLPCGAWWKRRVVSLCAQVKDTSTFWSIFVAAAVMGLVILRQHWQQERWQVLHQRWHVSIGDEVLLLVTLNFAFYVGNILVFSSLSLICANKFNLCSEMRLDSCFAMNSMFTPEMMPRANPNSVYLIPFILGHGVSDKVFFLSLIGEVVLRRRATAQNFKHRNSSTITFFCGLLKRSY